MAWIVTRSRKDGGTSYKVCWWDLGGRQRSRTFRRHDHASRYKRDIEHQKDAGTYRNPNLGKITVAKFYEHYMKTSPPDAESTRSLYDMHYRRYVGPLLGTAPINSLTMPGVKAFLGDLREAGAGDPTVSAVHRLVRRLLSVAVEEGRIPSNPAKGIKRPAQERTEMNFLEPIQVAALAKVVPARYSALVYLLAYTGARIGEAAALRVKHVDLLRRTVRIEEASKEVDGRVFTGPTKTRQKRAVALPPSIAEMLGVHLAQFSDPADLETLVFTSPQGQQLRQKAFRARVLKPSLAKAGPPPGVRTHDLRHTAVAIATQAGLHAKQIQEMLGHSSIQITFDTYGHLFKSMHGEAADRLDEILKASDQDATGVPIKRAVSRSARTGG
jgi:integrase